MITWLFRLVPIGLAGYAMTAGQEKVGEIGQDILDTVLEFKAGMEVRGAAKMLKLDMINGQKPPRNNFSDYLRRNMDSEGSDPALDPWEEFYVLEDRDAGLVVASCGPDSECDNDDDIEAVVKDRPGRKKKWGKGGRDRFGVERLRKKYGGGGE